MSIPILAAVCATLLTADAPFTPGDHTRSLDVDGVQRSYLVHIPPQYNGKTAVPLVLALHGAAMNGPMMELFCGLNAKADQCGFIVVYPNGTGMAGLLLTWNAGKMWRRENAHDVAFLGKLLDDMESAAHIDRKRVYATGMSNGAMMCYRLADELSERIAAIAPVAGTMVMDTANPKRPVSVLHFHGTADRLVPFHGPVGDSSRLITFKSVDDTIRTWVKIDGCAAQPEVADLPAVAGDSTAVQRKTFGGGKNGAEVTLFTIRGGGHTWPGRDAPSFLGKSTKSISANDLMWDFFQKHALQ